MKLSDWLTEAEGRLHSAGVEAARLEASVLAAHVLGVDRSWLFAHPQHEFNDLAGEQVLQRRERREPLAYILGWREFFGRRFIVNPAVLIPRQETETLVESALRVSGAGAKLLDIGTGSGCIAITLKLERPDLNVIAIDVSPLALEVARHNAVELGASVEFLWSDLFERLADEQFDVIVTNPPYIGRHEDLMPEVRDHEPELALYGGVEGDELIQRLAREAAAYLSPDGWLLTEVGHTQAAGVVRLFRNARFKSAEIVKDLSGVDRVVVARC
ncbi:MAG: peptide chain release factor N(5)-glutamine methyltransferase [Fimbriimonas sp.]